MSVYREVQEECALIMGYETIEPWLGSMYIGGLARRVKVESYSEVCVCVCVSLIRCFVP